MSQKEDSQSIISKEDIRYIGREIYSNLNDSLGYCYPASNKLVNKMKLEYDIPDDYINIKEVRLGKHGSIIHYVVQLKSFCLKEKTSSYTILIDITLDQYCDENYNNNNVQKTYGLKENIPKVNIFEPGGTPYYSI